MLNNTKKKGLAVVMDCWWHLEDESPIYKETWKHIVDFVNSSDIETVVLATYHYDIKDHWTTDWFASTHNIFFNGNPYRDVWIKNLALSVGTAPGYIYQTAPDILKADFGSKRKLFLHEPDQLCWYVDNVVPHVQDIWYLGCHWNLCLKDSRPLGYEHLRDWARSTDRRIFSRTDCVVTEEHKRPGPQELQDWQRTDKENTFQLKLK